MCFPVSLPLLMVAWANWQVWLVRPAQKPSRTLVTSARALSVAKPSATRDCTWPGHSATMAIAVAIASAAATIVKSRITEASARSAIPPLGDGKVLVRSKGAEVEMEGTLSHLWTMREGKATMLQIYGDPQRALEAAGLQE